MQDLTAIILAGGRSLRLGRNKALEVVCGKRLIDRVLERVTPLTNRVLVVTSREHSALTLDGVKVIVDVYHARGPLGGIYTGLMASETRYNLLIACDLPFLNTALLRRIVELSPDYDVVIPRLGPNMVEPLHAVYSLNCLPNMKAQLERNQLSVNSFLNTMNVRYIEREECERLDPQRLSFFNINYDTDLDKANFLCPEQDKIQESRGDTVL